MYLHVSKDSLSVFVCACEGVAGCACNHEEMHCVNKCGVYADEFLCM